MEQQNQQNKTDEGIIKIYGTKFIKSNELGDFNWMCILPEYSKSLFIFNDNEEFHDTNRKGRGNAIVRYYNKYNKTQDKPKSAGIPTGTLANGGYQKLNAHVIKTVTSAIEEIHEILSTGKYNSIYYSVGPTGKLGTGLFDVSSDVINYIDDQIKSLGKSPVILL